MSRQDVLRELQAAGVPYRAAICARLLHSVGHWCLAMDHHVSFLFEHDAFKLPSV